MALRLLRVLTAILTISLLGPLVVIQSIDYILRGDKRFHLVEFLFAFSLDDGK